MLNYTKNLSELSKDSLPEAGGKGANLGILINAGLPVPPGFVVTTSAYHAQLEAFGLRERIAARIENLQEQDIAAITEASEQISAWIEETPMPPQVQVDVSKTFESFTKDMEPGIGLSVAIRSSATAEDLPSASFAGQHDTFLGIYGKEAVLEYVKKCWVSLWTPQAIAYRTSMGFEHLKVDLAVVVQAMIAAEAAGVMFTANPVSGNRDEILISAGYGLGEAVVSGLITPDSFTLTKEGILNQQELGSKKLSILLTEKGTREAEVPLSKRETYCLGANELRQLTSLANQVEKHYGSPMDTEWALAQGKIYLLQARPITTLKSDAEALTILAAGEQILYQGKKAPFEMQIAMEYFPEPLSPLDFAYLKQRYAAFNALVKDIGMKTPWEQVGLLERESGAVAVRIGKVGLSPALLWKAPSVFITNFSKEARDLWQPLQVELDVWLASMETATRNTNDPVKLARLIERALNEFGELFHRRFFTFSIPALVTDLKFGYWVKKAVGKEKSGPLKESLLRALPFRTALQNKALLRLAQTSALKGRDSQVFKEEFKRFLEEYGDRPSLSTAPTLAAPVWREKPGMIHELIEALLQDAGLPDAEADFKKQEDGYAAAKKQVEQGLKPAAYQRFEKVLVRARSEVIVREESSFYMERLTACIRRMILKLGSLLAKKTLICAEGDVFFLFLEELAPVAQGKLDAREKIEKRKRAFAKTNAAHQKGVNWLVSSGSFPVFEAKKTKQTAEKENPEALKGLSASRGVYEGRVCIVRSPAEFNKLKKGDILVATYTAPVWTPLFKVAGAVIAETGSPSSHAAIVAREYGIPCVVAIENVTNILKDGQSIRVDGNTGVVTRLG